jgi:hypothetical protein
MSMLRVCIASILVKDLLFDLTAYFFSYIKLSTSGGLFKSVSCSS